MVNDGSVATSESAPGFSHCGMAKTCVRESAPSSGSKAMAQLVVPRSMPMLNFARAIGQ